MHPSPLFSLSLLLLAATVHSGKLDPQPTDPPDLRSKSLILVKVVWSSIILFVATFLAGISPCLVKKWKNEGLIDLLGTQFAGGVFLGTALIQFLSDSDEAFEHLTAAEVGYPFAFILASVGYLLAMLSDCIVFCYFRKQRTTAGFVQHMKSSSRIGAGASPSQIQVDDATDQFPNALVFRALSFVDTTLLIIGLCFHSLFQGISIGVMDTEPSAWRALWTIGLHRVFAAIAMGIVLLRTIPDHPLLLCIAYAFAFAISCPIGVAIGIVINATTPGVVVDWIYAIVLGLASGVFIYVSVTHLLSEGDLLRGMVSVETPHHKFLAVVLGVAVVAIARIWDTSSRVYGGG